jgi:hypothetical protein
VLKTAVFGGLFGQIWVKKGHFLSKKAGEKGSFLSTGGEIDDRGGFLGVKYDIMS